MVGANDAITGQAIMAYVIVRAAPTASDELGEEVRQHVAKKLGAIARPKTVIFTDELPKTRSGKIMRRLLRDVAEGRALGDTTTLADPDGGRGDQAPGGRVTDRGVNDVSVHWRLAVRAEVEPGPAVVFDMDGVLSDAAGRQHHLERPRRDWDAFFDAVRRGRRSSTEVARLLEVLDPTLHIVLLTARPIERAAADAGVARPARAPVGPARHARLGRLRRRARLQA